MGAKIPVVSAYSDFEEGYLIANRIATMRVATASDYSDFAILYRTNSQSRIFEEALRKRNIPYRIYGGQSFYQRKEIKDVVAYFRLSVNPADEEALKRVINYPARGIGNTTVAKVMACAETQQVSLWDVVSRPVEYGLAVNASTQNKLMAFAELIRSFAEMSATASAYELADAVVRRSGIMADIYADHSPENMSRQENVQELLNGIQDFCNLRREEGRDAVALSDFLAEVSLATDQDSDDDGDDNRVTLMTVHASKGLEFRHVFVVGLEEELFPAAMAMGSARELEEERRLLYVAITRAKETCLLSYAASRYRNGKPTASPPSRFIRDIDPAYLILPDGAARSVERVPSYTAPRYTAAASSAGEYHSPARRMADRVDDTATPKWVRIDAPASPSTPSASSVSDPDGLAVGVRIRHDRFGEGTVTDISGDGDNRKIAVSFDHVGQKHLLMKFAKFTILK